MEITFLAKQLRGPFKLAQLALQFGSGLWIVARHFPCWNAAQKNAAIQRWARQVLGILDLEVQTNSAAVAGFSGLVVSNHLSWLDVLVLQSLMPVAFVAKSEVRHWPVVGYLAHACATIFVDRASARSAYAMVEHTATAIAGGQAVVVFPEGTSSDGQQLGSFHANIFESAIRTDSQVQPLALQYVDAATGAVATAAHFTGDMTLLTSLRQVSRANRMRALVHLSPCIAATGHSRKTLAQQTHASIHSQMYGPVYGKA